MRPRPVTHDPHRRQRRGVRRPRLDPPAGSVVFEKELDANSQRHVRPNRAGIEWLRSLRGPGESYSDVILRIAGRR
jgi:hypothetical protein